MKLEKFLAALAVLTLATFGQAQAADLLYSNPVPAQNVYSNSGFYVGIEAGVNQQDGLTGFINPPANTVGGTVEDSTGWNGGFKLGYGLGNWGMFAPRIEAEYVRTENDADNITAFNAGGMIGTFPARTSVDANIFLANLIVGLPIQGWNLTPFAGVSAGYGDFSVKSSSGATTILDDSDQGFVWGLTAGVSYDVTRTVALDFSYRFLQGTDLNFTGPFAGGTLPAVNESIDNHQFNVGVRVKL